MIKNRKYIILARWINHICIAYFIDYIRQKQVLCLYYYESDRGFTKNELIWKIKVTTEW